MKKIMPRKTAGHPPGKKQGFGYVIQAALCAQGTRVNQSVLRRL
ncbi:hypothetical protein U703_06885 [Rhodobacter capsulatus YW1]|nr:hypothetical protein U703_06885 [Rhodobacter capsulatus YW1]